MINENFRLHSIKYFYKIIKYLPNNAQIFVTKRNENNLREMFSINNNDYCNYIYRGSRIIKKTSIS